MPKKRKSAGTLIENLDDLQIPDLQKKHYLMLGYKPYLSESGKVKWLSFDQHTYEKIKYEMRLKFLQISPKLSQSRKKKYKFFKRVNRFIRKNWIVIGAVLITFGMIYFANDLILALK